MAKAFNRRPTLTLSTTAHRDADLLKAVGSFDILLKGKRVTITLPFTDTHDLQIKATITSRRKVKL